MRIVRIFILTFILILSFINLAKTEERIRIVGSHTLYPFLTIVVEKFGKETGLKTPIVEATGTGGGFKLFCLGNDYKYPSIVAASRRITEQESMLCKEHNINDIQEILLGYDGIILANSVKAPQYNFKARQIFLALAKKVPHNGQLVENFYNSWHEIDPLLPNYNIEIYGPSVTSGTRNIFVELIVQKICIEDPEFKKFFPDKTRRAQECQLFREDGKFIEVGENDNLMIQKLYYNPLALGIFGYNFLEHNSSIIHASTINGVIPSSYNIAIGKYPIARPLYIYIKKSHLNTLVSMKLFIKTLLDNKTIGKDGYLVRYGLIPMKSEELENILKVLNI
ncbi:phosphate ABC transporter substrate-binding protein [Rickettsiales bacterium Ac37b]|nr:phosphate ABC transporter substrate-binding protein [Rickettsiales bacterium Ac37b]